ncbi:MAG: Na+/H+ antiporter NhaC family protein [Acidobacteriota bacterium]|nr:Na+/H+ antiporter NhaC family protein [Acidobacteriota bacterium]
MDRKLSFTGGAFGALLPFFIFLSGVAWLALAGAPDERGFWPVLLAALGVSLGLAKDRRHWCSVVLDGMSRPLVALMILSWLCAGVLANLMNASGFVDGLVWAAGTMGVTKGFFVATSFLICSAVSTATGTSLGTLILCAPLLYAAGPNLAADPVWLMGAILGGATFGDNISPVSDTTIASASTQGAEMGAVVRSRMKYALPAAVFAVIGFAILGGDSPASADQAAVTGSPKGLVMVFAPALAVYLLLRGRHLLEGLMAGIIAAIVIGLAAGTIEPGSLMMIDQDNFIARGLIAEGMEKGVGVSIFTLLLMGLTAAVEATGILEHMVNRMERAGNAATAERHIVTLTSAAVLLTTHAAVAILTVGPFAARAGAETKIDPCRRANLLDLTVSTWPFLLPYFIPTILASALTAGAGSAPKLSALAIGMHNLHSWGLAAVLLLTITVLRPKT